MTGRVAILIIVLGLTLGAQGRGTEFYTLYQAAQRTIRALEADKGVTARDPRWQQAEKDLLRTIEVGPKERGRRVFVSGGLFITFSPEYYLGRVYLGTGRPQEALQAFTTASRQSIDPSSAEFSDLGRLTTMARQSAVTGLIGAATVDLRAGRFEAARTRLQQARQMDAEDPRIAPLLAQVADDERVAAALRDARAALAKNDFSGARIALARAEASGRDNPDVSLLRIQINAAEFDFLMRTADQDQKAGRLTDAEDKARRALALGLDDKRVNDFLAALRPPAQTDPPIVTTPVPPPAETGSGPNLGSQSSERTGMLLFFTGKYDEAITALGRLESPRALLYRASSRAALLILAGNTNQADWQLARGEFQRVNAGFGLKNDELWISSSILQQLRRPALAAAK
jgi:tetratricopeptide (TPR) repeat protein